MDRVLSRGIAAIRKGASTSNVETKAKAAHKDSARLLPGRCGLHVPLLLAAFMHARPPRDSASVQSAARTYREIFARDTSSKSKTGSMRQ